MGDVIKMERCDVCKKSTRDATLVENSLTKVTTCVECAKKVHQMYGDFLMVADQENLEGNPGKLKSDKHSLPTAKNIKEILDEQVISQDKAKKAISIAIANHLRRLKNPKEITIKDNLLIIGPTGSGKTELARVVAQETDLPFVIVDCPKFTPSGYVGEDVSAALKQLLIKCDGDKAMAEQGIVFFDEFDKIISASNEGNKFKAASLQYEMLKMMEGGEIVIKGDGPADSAKSTVIDTKNILFLAAGSFYELETIVDKKSEHTTLGIHSSVGQPKVAYDWRDKADTGHLLTFGIIPELMGRFSQFVFTNPLTKADLLKIMYEPKNSLVGNYRALFRQDGVEVAFTEELLEAVVDEAILNKLGARGLRSGMGKRLEELSFNISDYKGKFVVLGPTGIQKVIEAEAKEPTKKTSKKVAVQG